MIRLFIRHRVADFEAWKKVYDDFDDERSGMGVIDHAVFQGTSDGTDITVWHDFESLDTATTFAESGRVRAVMGEAGVIGQPSLWFTEPA